MTEQEQMNDLIDKVHQWGIDRKIIGNGKLETQWLKLLSEFGEMCDTLAKGGDPIDDIGDQLVVLIMMAGIDGRVDIIKDRMPQFIHANDAYEESVKSLGSCYLNCVGNLWIAPAVASLIHLKKTAANHNLNLLQCLQHAYDEIKDRKGYLNEHGVFIKE